MTDVGDYAQGVRMLRNLVHPGRYLREYPAKPIASEHLSQVFAVLAAVLQVIVHELGSDQLIEQKLAAASEKKRRHELVKQAVLDAIEEEEKKLAMLKFAALKEKKKPNKSI